MMNHLVSGLAPMHPGELFREDILPALNKPKAEIARLLEVSRQTLYDILAEKQDNTPTMALRVGKATGTTPEMWGNKQRNYDLRVAAVKDADVLARIPDQKSTPRHFSHNNAQRPASSHSKKQ